MTLRNYRGHGDRRSNRLSRYDYGWAGTYFVTICTRDRAHVFGEIKRGVMRLNPYGQCAASEWIEIGRRRPGVILDAWVIMPNHMHGIVEVTGNWKRPGSLALLVWRGSHRRLTHSQAFPTGNNRGTLGAIIGSFKSGTTRQINLLRRMSGAPLWQRGYYERIVRDCTALTRFRQYIAENPARWSEDATA
jgi:putative transposase